MKAQYVVLEEVHVIMTPAEARFIKALVQNPQSSKVEPFEEANLREAIFRALAEAEKK